MTLTGKRAGWNDRAAKLGPGRYRCACGTDFEDNESEQVLYRVDVIDRDGDVEIDRVPLPAGSTYDQAERLALKLRNESYPDRDQWRVVLIERIPPPPLRCPPCGRALLEDAKEGRGPDYRPPIRIS